MWLERRRKRRCACVGRCRSPKPETTPPAVRLMMYTRSVQHKGCAIFIINRCDGADCRGGHPLMRTTHPPTANEANDICARRWKLYTNATYPTLTASTVRLHTERVAFRLHVDTRALIQYTTQFPPRICWGHNMETGCSRWPGATPALALYLCLVMCARHRRTRRSQHQSDGWCCCFAECKILLAALRCARCNESIVGEFIFYSTSELVCGLCGGGRG